MMEIILPSYEVVDFSKHIHYVPGFTNIGVLTTDDKKAYFIDSGVNENAALPAYEAFKEKFSDYELKAVLITHAHADHVGGNKALFDETKCEFWASRTDGFILELPEVMPSLITQGFPVTETECDYYYAKCKVKSSHELNEGDSFYLGSNLKVKVFSIPGHFLSQLGFLVTEVESGLTVFFAGDGIYGRSEVKKYWIPYNYNENLFMESLEKIRQIRADITVPSHGDVISCDILDENVELNSLQMIETEKMILEILKTPKTFEEILKEVADKNGLHFKVNQAYLIGSTIHSFLSCLQHKGQVKEEIKDNYIIWSRI